MARILGQLSSGGELEPGATRLCAVCASVAGMTGAGIMLMSESVPRGSVGSTDEVSRAIEELQYTLGEGPSIDAHKLGSPVVEADLADDRHSRWTAFTPLALAAGARAVFGFPLVIGAVRVGVLNFYRDRAGPLVGGHHADALVAADVAARAVLAMQANASPGQIVSELESGLTLHSVVHQASGMVAAQLDVHIHEALLRLRARAFAEGRPLTEIAGDVVARRLRLHHGPDPADEPGGGPTK